jgi:dTDP-4-amino-4,6-dideoxygalactose transaminase
MLPEGRDRDACISALAQRGVQAGILSYALHTLPHLRELPSARGQRFDNTQAIVRRSVALPLYPGMQESDSERVVQALSEVLA